jgi:tetratricopeptide (TPR) repeat protein
MANTSNLPKSQSDKAVWWIGSFLFLVTIYFNSTVQDPFNAPKFWVLLIGAAWLFGYLISYLRDNKNNVQGIIKKSIVLVIIFISFSTISMVMSKNNFVALLGDNMRKNGYLTYLSLSIIFLVTVFYVRNNNLVKLYKFMLLSALAVGGYGLLQMTGNDFINWSSSGMALFSTMGNSNFAGSLMAILATITLGGSYIYRKSVVLSSISIITFVILVITIFPTNARQGLLLLFFGISYLIVVIIYNFNRIIGRIAILISFAGLLASILGMLQIGPLSNLLYKGSVSVRGFYWRAGMEMFQNNILFGVGLDNYGSFFKQYREAGYPLKYGYSLTSTNAHNVFIQQFATGGIFVGISYILITLFVFWSGVKSLRKFKGEDRAKLAVFFIAWLAFQGQSIISIDNIGISIWGWVLAGVIIGLSLENSESYLPKEKFKEGRQLKKQEINMLQPITSIVFSVLTIILVVFLYRGESSIFKLRASYNPAIPAQKTIVYKFANETINAPLIDLQYKVIAATFLHGMDYKQEAVSLLEKLNTEDPYNLDAITALSSYFEMSGEVPKAISMREKLAVLDPWNAENYLQMAFDYKFIGDKINQQKYLDKTLSLDPSNPKVISAQAELNQ